ncbi:ABC transporter permease [Sphingomonas sp.]|uniref:ABC transporter permease n=1 Tax=Sphingomonas sp. TaxID=28214 RepID=UPI002DD6711F|nr:ABC transporter permease [Sphingomonas sp.]
MSARKTIRQTLTVARRDFIATVFTPTFLLFLLAPLIMLGFGLVGGLGAASMASSATEKSRIIVLASAEDGRRMIAADRRLAEAFARRDEDAEAKASSRPFAPPRPRRGGTPTLLIEAPKGDPAAQARAAFARTDVETLAVLYGPLDKPTVLHAPGYVSRATYLALLADEVMRDRRLGSDTRLSTATIQPFKTEARRASASSGSRAAFFTVFGLFILTLMLAGQAVGTMAEERSNKVIEILAAAVPLESVFLGKLIGMFGVAILFVGFWGTIVVNLGQMLPPNIGRAFADVGPATGAAFPFLFFAYFTMAYLLLGAVFLGIGAQASTPREIQMLSLPITIFQVAMFGMSQAAASSPESTLARFAEIFPFSSPFAMAARAANSPEIWPHLLALGWQALWVAATVWLGARLFRRGVLQSGSPAFWKRKKAEAAA